MALKGKKKSRTRGSQARRRPAAAPKPSYVGGREKARWYQTTQGLVIAFIVAAATIIFLWWFIADSRNDAQALEDKQEGLKTYTDQLRTVIDTLDPVAGELATAEGLSDEELAKKSEEWRESLTRAQSQLSQQVPPAGLEPVNALAVQAILLYVQSAEQYGLLPSLDDSNVQSEMTGKAVGSFQAANGIFGSIIQLIDTERTEADLSVSGLTAPSGQPQQPGTLEVPGTESGSDTIELPVDEGEGGGGGGGNNGGDNGNG